MKADCSALRAVAIVSDRYRSGMKADCSALRAVAIVSDRYRSGMKADCSALRAAAIAAGIRIPGYCPTYSYRLARPMSVWTCV